MVSPQGTRAARLRVREPETGDNRLQRVQARGAIAVRCPGGRVRTGGDEGAADCLTDPQGTTVELHETFGRTARVAHQLSRTQAHQWRSSADPSGGKSTGN